MEFTVLQVILALAMGVGFAYCEPPINNQYGVPGNFGGHGNHGDGHGTGNIGSSGTVTNSYGAPLTGGHDAHQDYIDSQPKSYEFGYAVKDAASGNDFGRRETSDGDTVRGEYRVQLPDGRTQIVTYTADWRTGFHADVRYEGTASYPDQYNNNNNNNNNVNNNNNNGYNNGGGSYNALNVNSLDNGYNGGNNGGFNNNYHGNNGNYNSGFNHHNNNNNNNNNNYDGAHNYNSNNNYDSNSLDGNYNYAGYSSNSFGSKAPVSSYGTPAFH